MEKKKKKYYAVARGRKTGIFSAWFGTGNAEEQIRGFAGARYKGFVTIEEAREWLQQMEKTELSGNKARNRSRSTRKATASSGQQPPKPGSVVIYTDGGCSCNPGPGGYGAVIMNGETRKEISGGFRLTTNNRMELMACIEGIKTLQPQTDGTLYSDSQYVVNAVTKGWAEKWRSNNWMRTKSDAAENYDLWEKLLGLCEEHTIDFRWVKGHAGNEENERCDHLATTAAAGTNLPPDTNYENGKTKITA